MKYWWVSQNSTFKQESSGGYLWSPKVNKNGSASQFYDNMTRVSVGDIVLSFESSRISAISVITRTAYSAHKPDEFGAAGNAWSDEGWKVDLDYHFLTNRVRPADYMDYIEPLLPSKYSPLQPNGRGNQAYLFELSEELFTELSRLINDGIIEEVISTNALQALVDSKESDIEADLLNDSTLGETTIQQLVKSRRGQGIFRSRVEQIETCCRITGVSNRRHLIASHIKPWRASSNDERLDGNNGLMLAPHIDHLFDKGFISFSDKGDVLISTAVESELIKSWALCCDNVGAFNRQQKIYLGYHREHIFIS
ncbi:putative restriction endonuclease [Vibrio crassostreae]|nr:putative restriction endonuclease [Vibrio crassostreae]CAK2130904.1 putative restriction endonuclease [Vibrio crassostreae]CAK2987203.1 putative restriction endonuclease [Vibrio crassostreae]CAK3505057.1 putative restriction endonuclease [Vibrio crassostreae]CAK3969471.1 putative restriction endonuclease [Vibrio crassostreae]